jgi:hypothetical protein
MSLRRAVETLLLREKERVLKLAHSQLAEFRTDVLDYDEDARVRKITIGCEKGEPILYWHPHDHNQFEMRDSMPDTMRLIEEETGLKAYWRGPDTAVLLKKPTSNKE